MLVMSCGEQDYNDCLKALDRQKYVEFDTFEIKDLPNKEAHQTLYKKIAELRLKYDIFVKLDGDTVFLGDLALSEIVHKFEGNQNLDHAIFPLYDWYSREMINGLSAFSSRVNFKLNSEELFLDYSPILTGDRIVFWDDVPPIAVHSPNPSIREAYLFGYHRSLKLKQLGRRKKDISQVMFQYALLSKVYRQYVVEGDLRRYAVLVGAEKGLKSSSSSLSNKLSDNYNACVKYVRDKKIKKGMTAIRAWEPGRIKYIYRLFRYIYIQRVRNFCYRMVDK